jgi:hypothetical protein
MRNNAFDPSTVLPLVTDTSPDDSVQITGVLIGYTGSSDCHYQCVSPKITQIITAALTSRPPLSHDYFVDGFQQMLFY